MARIRTVEKSLLFVGVLFADRQYYYQAYSALQAVFGEIVMETPQSGWNYSQYYREEMGTPIFRRFLFFRNPLSPDLLSEAKLKTIEIESCFSRDGKRQVNLDPGYLTPAKVVLASTKDYSHRIYLMNGIYAETTLIFKDKRFMPHLQTYTDYKEDRQQKIFLLAREMFFLLKINA
jgi:hypothetical protein